MTVEFRLQYFWYEFVKGDTVTSYPHSETFPDLESLRERMRVDILPNKPSKGMKLRYSITKITSEIVEKSAD